MILAGDIGGTKTNLGVFRVENGRLVSVVDESFPSREHASLEEIIAAFLCKHSPKVEHACFGVAGPVRNGRAETTNLAWDVQEQSLARRIGIATARVINDLEATAHGIATRAASDFVVLNPGANGAVGNAAVIAAGTGLGEAGLYWDGRRHFPFACEGGHSDFSPRDETETELFLYLHQKFGHVAWERVLSGPGLVNVYEFLRDTGRGKESPTIAKKMQTGDPAATISRAAWRVNVPCATLPWSCLCPCMAPRRGHSRSRSWPPVASISAGASRRIWSIDCVMARFSRPSSPRGGWRS